MKVHLNVFLFAVVALVPLAGLAGHDRSESSSDHASVDGVQAASPTFAEATLEYASRASLEANVPVLDVGLRTRDRITIDPEYAGAETLRTAVESGDALPTALASGDFDEDGVPDLVCAYASGHGGIVTLHRGNVDSIYPHDPAARLRRATETWTDAPFLSPARVFGLPTAPDFLGAGDFDNDSHLDLVAASIGGEQLVPLWGDGRGGFVPGPPAVLAGRVTAMVSGEINRADGLVELAVAMQREQGPALAIFESSRGALRARPEILDLTAPATVMVLGAFDGDPWLDVALGAGRELLIVRGRERRLPTDGEDRAGMAPPTVERVALPWEIRALTSGDFSGAGDHRHEIALLSDDGVLRVLQSSVARVRPDRDTVSQRSLRRMGAVGSEPDRTPPAWRVIGEQAPTASSGSDLRWSTGRHAMLAARVSGLPTQDLVILDPTPPRMHVSTGESIEHGERQRSGDSGPVPTEPESTTSDNVPVAVLAMRLNRDAVDDLVVMYEGDTAPVVNRSATAAVITVDTSTDVASPGDGACSLREAIANAEFNGDTTDGDCVAGAGVDAIEFSIAGGGAVATIALTSALPEIRDVLTLDATTQGCPTPPCIVLDGALAGPGTNGFGIRAGSSVVRGFVMHSFGGRAIFLNSAANIVEGNYLGTDLSGTLDLGNGQDGVTVRGGPSNTIGGTTAAARNLISGNDDEGVSIDLESSTGNRVQGNYIGTDVSGTLDLGNQSDGVSLDGSVNNVVGGVVAGAGNLISGNDDDGVTILSGESWVNRIEGNLIGTDVSGALALGNVDDGIEIREGQDNTVGGVAAGARNVVAGNGGDGVVLTAGTSGNQVAGNFIGIDVSGAAALSNADDGVEIGDASSNLIGGTTPEARNVIATNLDDGVSISGVGATGNQVQGNYIGTDISGTLDLGNVSEGVAIEEATGNTVGGTSAGAGNVISGNDGDGVLIALGATGNFVEGNYIGSDRNGTADLGNTDDGVEVRGATNNTVGGTSAAARNVISGNDGDGIVISSGASGNQVQGNYVGTDVTGAVDLGNSDEGVELQNAHGNTVGGLTAAARNIISGNDGDGLVISSGGTGNDVQGNYIGLDVSGAVRLANFDDGVEIRDGSSNTIGGSSVGAGNVISGNADNGVYLFSTAATGNQVQGNLIGIDASGTLDIGNIGDGVEIREATGNTIGGVIAGVRNVISGNDDDGVAITVGASGNLVQGNSIGTDAGGTATIANVGDGVEIEDSTNNTIGGVLAEAGNVIRGNGQNGVFVSGLGTGGGMILHNSIAANGLLGIALGTSTVLPNDPGDIDVGPNELLNYPVLSLVDAGPFGTTVEGIWDGAASTTLRLEFFSNTTCDVSGHGEGETFLGTVDVTTDLTGSASFSTTLTTTIDVGDAVAATATQAVSNVTSEFSACLTATEQCAPVLAVDKAGVDAQLTWNGLAAPTIFDVVQGTLSVLHSADGDFTLATNACAGEDESGPTLVFSGTPASGDGFWFLVRGDDCSVGSYDSGAPSQTGLRDGEIAASGSDCL